MGTVEVDVYPILRIFQYCGKYIYTISSVNESAFDVIAKNNLTTALNPMIEFLKLFFQKIVDKNSYPDEVKDPIKKQLSYFLISKSHFQMYIKENGGAENSILNAIEIRSAFSDNYIKTYNIQHLLSLSVLSLADLYMSTERFDMAMNVLFMERELTYGGSREKFYFLYKRLISEFYIRENYVNAYQCDSEAKRLMPEWQSNETTNSIIDAQKKCLTDSLDSKNRTYEFSPTHALTIQVNIDVWFQSYINILSKISQKNIFIFESGKLVIKKALSMQISDFNKMMEMLQTLEAEQHLRAEREKVTLAQNERRLSLEVLEANFHELSLESPSSSSGNSLSSLSGSSSHNEPEISPHPMCDVNNDDVASMSSDHPKSKAPKIKSRGKASKRRGRAKCSAQINTEPQTDAEKYGFSKSLFGGKKFHVCYSPADSTRAFYIVKGEVQYKGKPSVLIDKLISLLDAPKIVGHTGQEGFKTIIHSGKPLLVGKILGIKERFFPKFIQTNRKGDIALEYGNIIKTKNGIGNVEVLRYASPK